MSDNFSALGLSDIPGTLRTHTTNIRNMINEMEGSCSKISGIIGGNLGSKWQEVSNYYNKINERLVYMTEKISKKINEYIESTVTNEQTTSNEVAKLNENLSKIDSILDNIKF